MSDYCPACGRRMVLRQSNDPNVILIDDRKVSSLTTTTICRPCNTKEQISGQPAKLLSGEDSQKRG